MVPQPVLPAALVITWSPQADCYGATKVARNGSRNPPAVTAYRRLRSRNQQQQPRHRVPAATGSRETPPAAPRFNPDDSGATGGNDPGAADQVATQPPPASAVPPTAVPPPIVPAIRGATIRRATSDRAAGARLRQRPLRRRSYASARDTGAPSRRRPSRRRWSYPRPIRAMRCARRSPRLRLAVAVFDVRWRRSSDGAVELTGIGGKSADRQSAANAWHR